MNNDFGITDDVLSKILNILKSYPISKTILYGSRATGNYRDNSDIDLCIEANEINFSTLLSIENKIDKHGVVLYQRV